MNGTTTRIIGYRGQRYHVETDGAGTLLTMADPISNPGGAPVAVGSVNYTTGAISIVATTPAVFSGWQSQGFSYATVGGSSTSASYTYARYFVQPT
jgi:hypothetical protein